MWELRVLFVLGLIATAILTTLLISAVFAVGRAGRRWYHAPLRRKASGAAGPGGIADATRPGA
jgi:hypothetical protein